MNSVEGLTRYVESVSVSPKLLKRADIQELRESMSKLPRRLTESIDSDASEGWWVPISFYNKENGNGRIYNKKLWENVINNQKETYIGSPMLTDHPEGDKDGSPRDICGVWLDARLGDSNVNGIGLVYGLLVPSGHLGQDLKDHLANGLRIGTSSSGFGKLMRDGVTVDPDTYQIERLSDWVLNPSQGTFFSWDESQEVQDKSIRESQEYNTITDTKEKVVKDSKITKLEEKKFRRDMESFLESANNIKDPQERLEEFKEIRSYLEDGACPDLREKVEAKIAEQEAFIKEALREKIELQDELQIEGPKDLKEKLTKISEDVSILKTEAQDWKKISEKLQERYTRAKKALASRPSEAYSEYQRERIESLSKKLDERTVTATTLLKELKEAYEKSLEEKKALQEQIDAFNYEKICEACAHECDDADEYKKICEACACEGDDCKTDELLAENEKLKNQLKEANSQIVLLADSLNTVGNKYREAKKEHNDLLKTFKEYKENSLQENDNLLRENNNNASAIIEANKKIGGLINTLSKQKESIDTLSKENNVLKEANSRKRTQLTDLAKELKATKLNEAKKPVVEPTTAVEKYFESLYNQYGNEILPYKDHITKAITLSEAKKYFFKDVLQNLRESQAIENIRIPENLYTTPEERIQTMNEKKFTKISSVDRLPKGWM